MKVRVGLIGAGFVASIHASAYADIHDLDVELAAVAATSQRSADAFAARHGISDACADYRRMLERDDIQLVDVCTPNVTHEPIVVASAQAGKHVICEKPLTGYFGGPGAAGPIEATPRAVMLGQAMRSADRMLDATRQAGVKLMYAENWVYCPAIHRAVELAQAAGGTIFEIRGEESHSGSHATYAKSWSMAGGGALMRLAPHPIGAALYLKQQEGLWHGGKPIRVASVTAEVGSLDRMAAFQAERPHWVVDDWQDVENWCALVIAFEDGSRAVIRASDVSLGGIETPFQVLMSNGRILCDMSHSGLVKAFVPDAAVWGDTYLMEKVDHKGGWSYPSVDEHWMLGYPHEIRDFVEAVVHDREPRSTAELGREVVRVIYAAYQSAEEGRRIDLRAPSSF
jgi:predicted dehydrogenase